MAFSEITDDVEKVGPDAGGILAMTAGEDVTAGQVVKTGGDNSVQPSDTDGENVIGVATQTVSSGEAVTVASTGTIALVQSAEGISNGDTLTSGGGTTGEEGQVQTANTSADFVVGHALESTGGSGNNIQALITVSGEVS